MAQSSSAGNLNYRCFFIKSRILLLVQLSITVHKADYICLLFSTGMQSTRVELHKII